MNQINSLKKATLQLLTMMKTKGGPIKFASLFLNVVRTEGLAGVRRRISHVLKRDYGSWLANFDKMTDDTRNEIARRAKAFPLRPLISILMPVYNPPAEFLNQAIWSVRNQLYENWELCIADDNSSNSKIREMLGSHADQDSRVKLILRDENGHISAASNSALSLATGQYIGFLDHDDMLSVNALYHVVSEINRNPELKMIYSDEDKVDERGHRFDPHFKSDWNPELLFSHNYVCHFIVYKSDFLRNVGGLRTGYEGSQDYDLILRILKHVSAEQISHIPKILYHWRALPGSTARSSEEKNYSSEAGLKALQDYFQEVNPDIHVEMGPVPNSYRVRYPVPTPCPLVTIIIPTRDKLKLLKNCLNSILEKTTYANFEILIVNNQSEHIETINYLESIQQNHEKVRVINYDHDFNFSGINNFAVKHSKGEILALVNNDVEVISPEWLTEMVSHACRPGTGCVGTKLCYADGRVQHGGVILGVGGVAGHAHKYFPGEANGYFSRLKLTQNLSAVTAACLVVRKNVYEKVGGFDEQNLKVAFNDVDFCLKVRELGLNNIWTPYAEMYHLESESRGQDDNPEKQARFASEVHHMIGHWGQKLLNDPYYNPNLTLEAEDFSLAWPPRQKNDPCTFTPETIKRGKALHFVNRWGKGLEIGASYNPIAPKLEGYDVEILDHMTTNQLRKKYKDHDVNIDDIEQVDHVWQGQQIHELIGKTDYYDYIIASHVIEHVPDLVSFLNSCEKLLLPMGILSLVIPDKRYCFDFFRWPSSTGEVLQAFVEKRCRHTPGTVFDALSLAVKKGPLIAWHKDHTGELEFLHEPEMIIQAFGASQASEEYQDYHAWRFTPSSFSMILNDLRSLKLVNMTIRGSFDTHGCEFFVALQKSDVSGESTITETRMELCKKIFEEMLGSSIKY